MARRMIEDSIWKNEKYALLPFGARLLLVGMVTNADDQGRGKAHPIFLRAAIFPYDDIAPAEISEWLKLIEANETIILYNVDGKDYYQLSGWWKYQSHPFAAPSHFPKPASWSDRVRITTKGRVILTCNWLTSDNTLLINTCDEYGKPIIHRNGSKPSGSPPGTQAPDHVVDDVDNHVVDDMVDHLADQRERERESKSEISESDLTVQPARAREATPTASPPTVEISFDPPITEPPPRKPSKQKPVNHGTAPPGQYVKRDTGESPYWVFREYTRRSMTNLQIDAINATVTDIAQWRKVCERWAELYGDDWYKFGHLDWYRNGIPSQNGANNGRDQRQRATGNTANGRAASNARPGAGQPASGSVQADGYKADEFKLTVELVNKRISQAEYDQRLVALKSHYGMPGVSGTRPLSPS